MIAQACMIGLGFAAIGLGFKGFTEDGIPFSTDTKITGPTAAVVGIGCMLVGSVLIATGISPSTLILMLLGDN